MNGSNRATIGGGGMAGLFAFTGGVYVAAGDVNGDGFADVVVGADAGTSPQIQVFDGRTYALLANFYAFNAPQFRGGVRVAVGDVNGDGKADIVVAAGKGGGPQVQVYDGATLSAIGNWYAFNAPGFTGGVYVGAGDMNGDGFADVICSAGQGGGPQVERYDGRSLTSLGSFFVYSPGFTGGVRVGASIVGGRGAILTGAGPGGGPQMELFDGQTLAAMYAFFAYGGGYTGGVFVG
jgi:hypothetical protein